MTIEEHHVYLLELGFSKGEARHMTAKIKRCVKSGEMYYDRNGCLRYDWG